VLPGLAPGALFLHFASAAWFHFTVHLCKVPFSAPSGTVRFRPQ